MSILDFFTGGADPQAEANRYLSKIPAIGQQYYNPFITSGQEAGNVLKGAYGNMLDPNAFIDNIMKNYSMSKGAQYERDELGRGIGATAAAGGYAGTPEHERLYGEMADKIMSGDMQQYLQNALNVYGTGLTGEKDIYDKGYESTGALTDLLTGTLGSQAGLGFQSASQSNTNRQGLMSALAKLLATGTGAYFGGVPGAEAGAKIF